TCDVGGMRPLGVCGVAPYPARSNACSASTSARAPRMLPVCGQVPPAVFGIGTTLTLNTVIETVGSAADEAAGRLAAMRPSADRQIDPLRITISLFVDDRLMIRNRPSVTDPKHTIRIGATSRPTLT